MSAYVTQNIVVHKCHFGFLMIKLHVRVWTDSSYMLRPAVPAADGTQVWNIGGIIIGRGNLKYSPCKKTCLSATFVHHIFHMDYPGAEHRPLW